MKMTRLSTHLWRLPLMLGLLCSPDRTSSEAPSNSDLGKWGLHCFCIDAASTPQRIVRMQDNGRLLASAVGGTTIARLRQSGIQADDNQLALLRLYGLIEQRGDLITTAIPTLSGTALLKVRAASAVLGKRIANQVRPAAAAIVVELDRRGLSQSGYAIVFGYALDTLFWEELAKRGALPETKLDKSHPLWRGAFWAISPERTGAAGVNEEGRGTVKLSMVWSDAAIARVKKLAASETGRTMVRSLASADAAKLPPELMNGNRPAFPLIGPDDQLSRQAAVIAKQAAQALSDDPAGRALIALVGHADREQALVIVAHELIWDIADALEANGTISKPAALRSGVGDLMPLLFARFPAPQS